MAMNYNQEKQNYYQPAVGAPITRTTGTLDMIDDMDKFRRHYQGEYYAGFRYRKVAPIHSWTSTSLIDMETREEPGFLIAVSETQLRELVRDALEGAAHRDFRDHNAAAAQAYEEYRLLFALTQNYDR
jgi:hypothetical protein